MKSITSRFGTRLAFTYRNEPAAMMRGYFRATTPQVDKNLWRCVKSSEAKRAANEGGFK